MEQPNILIFLVQAKANIMGYCVILALLFGKDNPNSPSGLDFHLRVGNQVAWGEGGGGIEPPPPSTRW